MLKWVLIVVLVVGALGAVGWVYVAPRFRAPPAQWKTEAVTKGDIKITVTSTGTVGPVQTVQVGSQISGRVKEVLKLINDSVKKGDVLARLDTELLESEKRSAEVNLSQTRAALSIIKVENDNLAIRALRQKAAIERKIISVSRSKGTLGLAMKNRKRYQDLLAVDATSQTELDIRVLEESNAQHDMKLLEIDLEQTTVDQKQIDADAKQLLAKEEQANADIMNAEAALARVITNLGYATIYSPIDGVVLQQLVEPGQTIAASFQTPNMFKIASELDKVRIDAQIDEADIGKIKPGQTVTFEVDAFRDDTFSGKVDQVQLQSESKGNLVTYPVRVNADNPPSPDHPYGKLLPGMTAGLRFVVDKRTGVLLLPSAALRFIPPPAYAPPKLTAKEKEKDKDPKTKHGAHGTVYVANAKGDLEEKPVRVGENDGDYFELLSGDLKEGDQIVVGQKL